MKKYVAMICVLMLLVLAACGQAKPAPAATAEPTATAEPSAAPTASAEPTPSAEPTATPSATPAPEAAARQDGERFEDVIILEGMEETVKYEHVRSDALGLEMDYEYESFVRHSEADREKFILQLDGVEDPEIYLEIVRTADSADAAAAAVSAELSKEYALSQDSYTLSRAGSCIRIDASAAADGSGTTDVLQTVYVIPTADGCLVATAHYTFDSADGFGTRFSYMVNSLSLLSSK